MNLRPRPLIRVLIIDDPTPFREELAAHLQETGDFYVAGKVDSPQEAIEQYKTLQPDVVMINFTLSATSGLEIIRSLKNIDPRARIIFLTNSNGPHLTQAALNVGVIRFVSIEATFDSFVEKVHEAVQHDILGSGHFMRRLVGKNSKN